MKVALIILATVFITINVVGVAAIFLMDRVYRQTAEADAFDDAWLFSDEWDEP